MKCKYLSDPLLMKRCGKPGKKRQTTYGIMIFCDEHYEIEKQEGRIKT